MSITLGLVNCYQPWSLDICYLYAVSEPEIIQVGGGGGGGGAKSVQLVKNEQNSTG
jgi:hypothetical protein